MNVIQTRDLTKYYGKIKGIENVTFSVEKGDFFGVIGPNGAGKSTLLRTLLGLVFPSDGKGEIFGLDIVKDKKEILSRIGYLPSEINYPKGMRVKDILSYSARLRGLDCSKEAAALCKRLDLDPNRKADDLSFGNRKKVGIVCALQAKPDLYIFDEPTGGLDPLMQKEFFTILEERNKEGATVLLSSHVLSEVERYCKSAAIIRNGQVLFSDRVENLRHNEVKKVCLKGVGAFDAAENVKNLKFENNEATFLFSGTASELVKMLSKMHFSDFTVTDPVLEEVFMHYYRKEEGK